MLLSTQFRHPGRIPLRYGAWPMFIKRNCVWLIAATLVASNLSQARAGGGFMDKVQEGSQYVNEAKQVEGTAKQIDEKAGGLFKKKTATDAATASKTGTTTTDSTAMDVKTTEVKTSDSPSADSKTTTTGEATSNSSTTTTSK
jgi:hypothetical protein